MTRVASHAKFIVVFAAILAVGWGNDRASCVRHNVLVPEVNAISQYAADAAVARQASATLEARTNPKQAVIDLRAARQFLAESKSIHTKTLACGSLLPATH